MFKKPRVRREILTGEKTDAGHLEKVAEYRNHRTF
jgi:hypothetical protein